MVKLAVNITQKRGLTLIVTRDDARKSKTALIGSLILEGPLFTIAADEWLPSFALSRIVRRQAAKTTRIGGRLKTVRASTYARLLDSLICTPSRGEPILVLEFLHTFYDSDVPLRVRYFKLRECCRHLKRLAFFRAVIVMIQEMPVDEYGRFSAILRQVVDKTVYLVSEAEPGQIPQPALF